MDDTFMSPESRRKLRRRLLTWFDRNRRELPWRGVSDPYGVWISEIMLQQTQVATVIPYYQRFMAALPDAKSLAAASAEQVLRLWEGLGYYRRARQMHKAAQVIVEQHGGEFPQTFEAVLALPGIGRYTAGAILSIALDQQLPILEANTIRLFSRLILLREQTTTSSAQKQLWKFAEEILPRKRAGDFNQALMELGALVCTPRAPQCDSCPLASLCPAQQQNLTAEIPAPKQKMKYEDVQECAVVVHHNNAVLLRQCQPGERWQGLWDFPRFPLEHGVVADGNVADGSPASKPAPPAASRDDLPRRRVQELTGVKIDATAPLTVIKHGVTRFRITLHCYQAAYVSGQPAAGSKWLPVAQLRSTPLSTTGRKISDLIISQQKDQPSTDSSC